MVSFPKLFTSLLVIPSTLLSMFNLITLILYFTDVASVKGTAIVPYESYIEICLCSLVQFIVCMLNVTTTSNILQKDMSKCLSSEPTCVVPEKVSLACQVALCVFASMCLGMNVNTSFSVILGIRTLGLVHLPVASSVICLLVALILNSLIGLVSIINSLVLMFVKSEDENDSMATKYLLKH